jgi:aspartate racemase
MGPLASNEFLQTLYSYGIDEVEQSAPIVVMYSDPTVPDRTQALLSGNAAMLLDRLKTCLGYLLAAKAEQIAICCVTMHSVVPMLPEELRAKIVSLVDGIIDAVAVSGISHLLLCSEGTRKVEIFQSHPRWKKASSQIILPSMEDQEKVSRFIYEIKRTGNAASFLPEVGELLLKYKTKSFVAGCTEFHILSQHIRRTGNKEYEFIDPLDSIARSWASNTEVSTEFQLAHSNATTR